jgi:hypothetical protein
MCEAFGTAFAAFQVEAWSSVLTPSAIVTRATVCARIASYRRFVVSPAVAQVPELRDLRRWRRRRPSRRQTDFDHRLAEVVVAHD